MFYTILMEKHKTESVVKLKSVLNRKKIPAYTCHNNNQYIVHKLWLKELRMSLDL